MSRCSVCTALLATLAALALGACSGHHGSGTQRGFYYWRSTFDISAADLSYLKTLHAGRLYVKVFDVDWQDGQCRPVAPLQFHTGFPKGTEIIPTVFITTRVLRQMNPADTNQLAGHIVDKMAWALKQGGTDSVGEVQFDSDWTSATRQTYFALLRCLGVLCRQRFGHVVVSATIRLHQVKYTGSAGIPPVDRGMLMMYNMGRATEPDEPNSIFNAAEARKYTDWIERYPLPLDVALPLYSWGVVFHLEQFSGLINNLTEQRMDTCSQFRKTAAHTYTATADVYLDGQHIFQDDVIRVEETDMKECASIAKELARLIHNRPLSVALYHLHPTLITRHDIGQIRNLYQAFED